MGGGQEGSRAGKSYDSELRLGTEGGQVGRWGWRAWLLGTGLGEGGRARQKQFSVAQQGAFV